ncbi:MAG TPA: protein kinase [Thermoanaerobaculia bacterium]|nr:protein kinase [Thermoanaerobaculia bacterium]
MNPGTQLGPYRVESLIGAGGMGEVYLGVDTRLDRQVAIKILAGAMAKDPALRERFEREARTISSLSHPNICTLFDLGRHNDNEYLVMEVPLDGGKPQPWLQTGASESDPSLSPDGQWVAYLVEEGAESELFVRPFPKGRPYRVSTDGGGVASWSADGRELVWASKGRMLAASFDPSGAAPRIERPRELFRLPEIWSTPRLLPDGRIAVIVPGPGEETTLPLHFTTAWRMKMKQ